MAYFASDDTLWSIGYAFVWVRKTAAFWGYHAHYITLDESLRRSRDIVAYHVQRRIQTKDVDDLLNMHITWTWNVRGHSYSVLLKTKLHYIRGFVEPLQGNQAAYRLPQPMTATEQRRQP